MLGVIVQPSTRHPSSRPTAQFHPNSYCDALAQPALHAHNQAARRDAWLQLHSAALANEQAGGCHAASRSAVPVRILQVCLFITGFLFYFSAPCIYMSPSALRLVHLDRRAATSFRLPRDSVRASPFFAPRLFASLHQSTHTAAAIRFDLCPRASRRLITNKFEGAAERRRPTSEADADGRLLSLDWLAAEIQLSTRR